MDDSPLGCSKCRFSLRGCKRCKDPAFRTRQLARAAKAQPDSAQHQDATTKRRLQPEDSSKAPETDAPPARKRRRRGAKLSAQVNAEANALAVLDRNGGSPGGHASAKIQGCTGKPIGAGHARIRTGIREVGSGLELGLAAGLLSLPGDSAAEGQSLENRKLEQHGQSPPARTGASLSVTVAPGSSDVSCRSTQAAGAVSEELSRGQHQAGSAIRQECPEEEKQRQRNFMDLLHRKIQQQHEQRQQQSSGKSAPLLALALASGARQRKKKERKEFAGDPRVSLWEPPQSPFGLIEEQLFSDPWKLLVACILLNKTSVLQVRKVIWKLFEMMPTPEAGMVADVAAVQKLIEPLGLAPKRAPMLIRFSREYVEKQWMDPVELHGVGQYAADAYNIFCRGDWRSVAPKDKDLLRYHQWLIETGGEGSGLMRDAIPGASGNCTPASEDRAERQREL